MNISLAEAKWLAIYHQLLTQEASLSGKIDTLKAIEQLGYVQIDTISVVSRAHHHTLWSRIKNYQRSSLKELEAARSVFEYWAHAASYLPMKDYRFSLKRKEDFLHGNAFWFKKDLKRAQYVLDRIKAEGALMSKDFKNERKKDPASTGMDWASNPYNLALRQLFMEGKIMVAHRRGFQKTYDLPENVLPSDIDTTPPSRKAYLQYLIERDIRAHGLVRQKEIGYLLRNTGKGIGQLLAEMTRSGKLIELKIKGITGPPFFTLEENLKALETIEMKPKLHILSPFDNLVIQRQRAMDLFGFNYTLECYVPAAKRKVGYFSLPILWGTKFVGQIDAKADRKAKIFYLKNLVWEKGTRVSKRMLMALQKKLLAYAHFNQCEQLQCSIELKKRLDPLVVRILEN